MPRLLADARAQIAASEQPALDPDAALGLPMPAKLRLAIAEAFSQATVARAQLATTNGARVADETTAPLAAQTPPHRDRRIRLGYVCSFFGAQSAMQTGMLHVFGLHNRMRYEVFCYSTLPEDGSLQWRQVEAECEHLSDISTLPTFVGRAARLAADDLDVLVDVRAPRLPARSDSAL